MSTVLETVSNLFTGNPGGYAVVGATSGVSGMLIGTGFTYLITNAINKAREEELILQLDGLPTDIAKKLNECHAKILNITLDQLKQLDKGDDLRLSEQVSSVFAGFSYLHSDTDSQTYQAVEFPYGKEFFEHSTEGAKNLIHKYFSSYETNRKKISSENRAAARAIVQLIKNTCGIFNQLLESIASQPGIKNQYRLQRLKDIIDNYFENILRDEILVGNFYRNLIDNLTSRQRVNLIEGVKEHYSAYIDSLLIKQRDHSIQELAEKSNETLHGITSSFLDIVARLFDSETKNAPEISSYEFKHNILRPDSAGTVFFRDSTINHILIKPLAAISEELNDIKNSTDFLGHIRNHEFFTDEDKIESLKKDWHRDTYAPAFIQKNRKPEISQEIIDICELLFYCRMLEKSFKDEVEKIGTLKLFQADENNLSEYDYRRFIFNVLYDKAQNSITKFFASNDMKLAIESINNPKWLANNSYHTIEGNTTYQVSSLEKADPVIGLKKTVVNTPFGESIVKLNSLLTKKNDIMEGLDKIKNSLPCEQDDYIRDRPQRDNLFYFNICCILRKHALMDIIPHSKSDTVLASTLYINNSIDEISDQIANISGKFRQSASSNLAKIKEMSLQLNSLEYNEKKIQIPEDWMKYLRQYGLVDESNIIDLNLEKDNDINSYVVLLRKANLLNDYINVKYEEALIKSPELADILIAFLTDLSELITKLDKFVSFIDTEQKEIDRLTQTNMSLKEDLKEVRKERELSENNYLESNALLIETESAVNELSQLNEDNAIKIDALEKKSNDFALIALRSLQDIADRISASRKTLNKKLTSIESTLDGRDSKEVSSIDFEREFKNIRKELDASLRHIECRITESEEMFLSCQGSIKEGFAELQKNIARERNLINNLQAQINLLKEEIASLQEKNLRLIEENNRQAQLIEAFQRDVPYNPNAINSIANLFLNLEDQYRTKNKFKLFESYRDNKTNALMMFIKNLLDNKTSLQKDIKKLNQRTIEQWINTSAGINLSKGNNSTSGAVIREILRHFKDDSLEESLQNGEILYHNNPITLEDDQINYLNKSVVYSA